MDNTDPVSVTSSWPRPPIWCPACGQAMRYHPKDVPGTRLYFRCLACQVTWTLKKIMETETP